MKGDWAVEPPIRLTYQVPIRVWKKFFLWGLTLAICACSGLAAPEAERVFIPPTQSGAVSLPVQASPSPTPAPLPLATTLPSPTPPCTNNLLFVEDLTIPDGTIVSPGDSLDKRWLVENNGSCNWEAGYRLELTAGQDLGAQAKQALYPARSGTQATIRIEFKAPAESGGYRSAWQAISPDGQVFGDPIFIEIQVTTP